MLLQTFCHVPGVGEKIERKIWKEGITSWEEALNYPALEKIIPSPFSRSARSFLYRSLQKLEKGEARFFKEHLDSYNHWRLFPHFQNDIVFLDIETTGLNSSQDYVTAITTFDGTKIKTFIQGINLPKFKEEIMKYKVMVTFNGKCFDIPFLEQHLGIKFPQVHLDLRFILRSLGFRGGLKACEKALGIDRGELRNVNGYTAVLLWQKYREGCPEALETLLAYNVADTVNLERLMVFAYNEKLRSYPFPQLSMSLPPKKIIIPYQVHPEILQEINHEYWRTVAQKEVKV
ncbi:MAG: ribonuclease H-like domain-containing protein [Candidatus Atribacteria bacterium]|nr:ribonuclease H-like domain-containing protein [Candidatus Atribacteria bacterium]